VTAVVPAGEYQVALGERLRAIRNRQGLSLHQVEEKSAGRWKAVVVGSYERADRSLTVDRLAGLAEFYGVPLAQILPPTGSEKRDRRPRLVISLPALASLPPEAQPIRRYVQAIREQRSDWAGDVLSLRGDDVRSLAAILTMDSAGLFGLLDAWGLLAPSSVTAADELDGWTEAW
jgi:transcriptional regulator with XRE-family HTH domain